MNDSSRMEWLEQDTSRLEDVRGRVENEACTVREAIDWFIQDGVIPEDD